MADAISGSSSAVNPFNGGSCIVYPHIDAETPTKPPATPITTVAPTTPVSVPVVRKTTNGSTKTDTIYRTSKTQETALHELTDNGTGSFGPYGTINYEDKTLSVRLLDLSATTDGYKSDHENAKGFDDGAGGTGSDTQKGGYYLDNAVSEELLAASTVSVSYGRGAGVDVAGSMSYAPPVVSIDLCPYTSDYIVPGSVRFTWMGHVFEDHDGVLIRDRTASNVGYVAGQINYSSGIASVTDYIVSGPATSFTLESLWTVRQKWNTASLFFRTQAAPIKPSGFVMNLADSQGNEITATGDLNGNITGPHLRGNIEYQTGIGELQFGDYVLDTALTPEQKTEWWYSAADVGAVEPLKIWRPWPVDPTTLRYNTVSFFYLPIDADILGLDPVRLPQDGRVPIYRVGGHVVVGHTGTVGPVTVSSGQTINCARNRLSRVRLIGSDGKTIPSGYSEDLDAGRVSIDDSTGWAQPITVEHRIEQLARVRDVQINGTLGLVGQLNHDFPAGSIVSSAMVAGTLQARVSAFWDQQSWDSVTWADALVGNKAPATYNDLIPVEVTNAGAMTERFALKFISSTTFECLGEHVGGVGTGSINTDFAPVNPITGAPYFTIRALGWGTGWAASNVQFLHTVGAIYSYSAIRTVQPGPEAGTDFDFGLLTRGDVGRPST